MTTTIQRQDDGRNAQIGARIEMERVQLAIDAMHNQGRHADAEALTLAAECADLDAGTWGEAYLALHALGR